jgi:hypothetical protein
MAQHPLMTQCFLITEASRSQTIKLGRNPLEVRTARRRDLYLTTHNTQMRQTSMPPAGFKPTIPASEQLQTQALDLTATGIAVGCD